MGVLSKHSEVFRDMLRIPQPPSGEQEQFDGCPLVELSDGVDDVRHMLSALYDGGNPEYVYIDQPILFPVVAAMLRLGTIYQIHRFRKEAIQCLQLSFPSTLSEMDAVGTTKLSARTFPSISIRDEEFMDLITVACECDLPSILPATFYGYLNLKHEQMAQGMAEDRWSPSDFAAFYRSLPFLQPADMVYIRRLLLQTNVAGCLNLNLCRHAFRMIVEEYVHKKALDPRTSTCLQPGQCLPTGGMGAQLCSLCLKAFLADYESGRTAAWDQFRTSLMGEEKI